MQDHEYTDDCYEELMNAHRDLSGTQSRRLDAALVLLLSHELNDRAALRRCLQAARDAVLREQA